MRRESHKWIAGVLTLGMITLLTSFAKATKPPCKVGDAKVILTQPNRQLNSPPQPSIDFQVQRKNNSVGCDFWVGVTRGTAPTYDRQLFKGADQIDYDIYKNPTTPPVNLKTFPDAVSVNEVYTGMFTKGPANPNAKTFTTQPRVLRPFPGPFKVLPPGTYSDSVVFKVYSGLFPPAGSPLEIASATQSYTYSVSPFAILSLLDTGVPYTDPPVLLKTVNFGNLTAGKVMTFDMVLLFNSGFKVTFRSVNGSRMKHETKSTFVPYTMRLNGVPKSLPSGIPVLVMNGSAMSPAAPLGQRVQVETTIASVAGVWAGNYADSIQIVMTSQ